MMARAVFMLMALLLPTTASAQVVVMPVQGTNLSSGEIDAIGVIFSEQYARFSDAPVIGPARSAPALASAGSPARAAGQLGASEYVELSAVRLASKIVVRATLHEASGALLFTEEMTAASLDDMQQVGERLAWSLYDRLSARETRTIHNITESEGRPTNRLFVEKVMGLKTSFVAPLAAHQKISQMVSLQFDGRLESDTYFLELGAGAVIPATGSKQGVVSYGGLFAEIGASYYLSNGSASPYVGGGIIPRIVFTEDADDGGVQLAPYGQIGVMLMRESSSRVYVELRIAQVVTPLVKTREPSYTYDSYGNPIYTQTEGRNLYPTEITLSAGIGW